jgi:hypothetical protein
MNAEDPKLLYKVTGLTTDKLTALMRTYKNVKLIDDRTVCFVFVLKMQEPALMEWCRKNEATLYSRYAGWQQIVP